MQARQRLSEDRYEELICGSWHKIPWGRTFLLSSSPLLLWDLNAKSLVPLQFLPTIQSFHSQPSHLMDLPWNLSSLASFSFTYLIPRHLSYPSYRDFFISNKTVWSAKASRCQPVSAITRCSFIVAPPSPTVTALSYISGCDRQFSFKDCFFWSL